MKHIHLCAACKPYCEEFTPGYFVGPPCQICGDTRDTRSISLEHYRTGIERSYRLDRLLAPDPKDAA